MSVIPVFKFGSKALEDFKNQYSIDDEYTFKYLEQHWWNSFPVEVKSMRKLWRLSGIQYIINHGKFMTLETSIAYQQHTISESI